MDASSQSGSASPEEQERKCDGEPQRAAGLAPAAALEAKRPGPAAAVVRIPRRVTGRLIGGGPIEPCLAAAAVVARDVAVEGVRDARRADPNVGVRVSIEAERREHRPR